MSLSWGQTVAGALSVAAVAGLLLLPSRLLGPDQPIELAIRAPQGIAWAVEAAPPRATPHPHAARPKIPAVSTTAVSTRSRQTYVLQAPSARPDPRTVRRVSTASPRVQTAPLRRDQQARSQRAPRSGTPARRRFPRNPPRWIPRRRQRRRSPRSRPASARSNETGHYRRMPRLGLSRRVGPVGVALTLFDIWRRSAAETAQVGHAAGTSARTAHRQAGARRAGEAPQELTLLFVPKTVYLQDCSSQAPMIASSTAFAFPASMSATIIMCFV